MNLKDRMKCQTKMNNLFPAVNKHECKKTFIGNFFLLIATVRLCGYDKIFKRSYVRFIKFG